MKIENTKTKTPGAGLRRKKSSTADAGVDSGRLSILNENNRQEIIYIDSERLIPYHKQSRRNFDEGELKTLAETIQAHGIRQPLTVMMSPEQDGFFEVISGERRLRAAQLLEIQKLPCILLSDASHAEEIALIENIQRKDLHPLELGAAYANLIKSSVCKTQKEVAEKIGVSRTHVVELMSFIQFPEEVKDLLIEKNIQTRQVYRKIARDIKEGGSGVEVLMRELTPDVAAESVRSGKAAPTYSKNKKMIVGVFTGPDGITISNQTSSMRNIDALKNIKKELRRLMYLVDGQIDLINENTFQG